MSIVLFSVIFLMIIATEKELLTRIKNELFYMTGNTQLCKLWFKEGVKHKASLISVPKIDCFYWQWIVWSFVLAHLPVFFFQIHPNSKFQKSSLNPVLSGFTIDPNKNLIVGNAEHLMALETSFTKDVILDMWNAS